MEEPQKPKPASDGKQRTGHSYSTRSNAKQASYCVKADDDRRSGSQAQQPQLKRRRTRLGARPAGTSVGINNDDATSDLNSIDTNTVDECTPAQIPLQNDLVLETLFRYVNRSDLLSCRIVNKQWQDEATKELRRRKLIIRFSFYSRGYQKGRNMLFRDISRRLSECRNPSLLSSFQVKTVACNELGSGGVGSIFATVGTQLKHLTLHLNYSRKNCSFERSSFMTHLKNLLFHEAPNLEFLEIKFHFPDYWEDELKALNSFDHHRRRSRIDPNAFRLLLNLKQFNVSGSPPSEFFADVINAAVNLRSFGGDWSTCIKYIMGADEGRKAKIHQFKSLELAVHSTFPWNQLDLELIETFLREHKQNLKLESFEYSAKLLFRNAPSALRIVSVINQILECSAESLVKLSIEPTKVFKDLLIIPRLPKLIEIFFDCFRSNSEYIRDSGGFFPPGFSMSNNFPNISTIVLLRCKPFFFRKSVSRMGVEVTGPVPSIRYIILIDGQKNSRIFVSQDPPLVTDFRHVFPNLVSISYVDSDTSYKI